MAAGVAILGSGLLMPIGYAYDLPGLPPIGGERIVALTLLALALAFRRGAFRHLRSHGWLLVLPLVAVLSPFASALGNTEPYFHIKGMTLYDGFAIAESRSMDFAIPFVLGLVLVRKKEHLRTLLMVLCVGGLLYSLLALYEIRMSPRLHIDIYGYNPTKWNMTKRFGGWRPTVFMPSGLAVGLFMASAALAATVLARTGTRAFQGVAAYLSVVLVLCKSLASIVYGAALIPVLLLLNARRQAPVVVLLCLLVLTYPATRMVDIFPTDALISLAGDIESDRASSLAMRFRMEDTLLDHGLRKPLFGWSGWRRNRPLVDTQGTQTTVTDGLWIIILGSQGLVGFAAVFGLLIVPPLMAVRNARRVRSRRLRLQLTGLAMIIAVNAIDLIPNAFLMTFTTFASGALAGMLPDVLAHGRRASRAVVRAPRVEGSAPPARAPAAVASLLDASRRPPVDR